MTMDAAGDAWLLAGAVLVLLLLSAFFSGSETALTAVSRARVHRMAQGGDKRAIILDALLAAPERLIGAILLGNNLVNILASALTTSLFIRLFGAAGVVWATLVMTALVLVFGEVLPKTYAIIKPDRFALAVGRIIRWVVVLFAPVVMVVEFLVRGSLRLLGADISRAGNPLSFREELRGALDLGRARGEAGKDDADMLDGQHASYYSTQFGIWEARSNSTVYQAATDGMVTAINEWAADMMAFTDGNNPPTTERTRCQIANGNPGLCMPVRKGDYWRVTSATKVWWLPLGS